MQEQEKNNKGFSLLEIIVVLAIVGALAGVGIPNFAKWNNKRIIANASEEVASLLRNIHATTERGTFAYVQLIFESDFEDGISIKTKGVTMDNFTTKMNDTSVSWNTSPDNRCSVTPLDDEFWTSEDTDRDELKANIFEISRSDVVFNFIGEASLCLSRNGKFYYGTGAIATGEQPENYIYLLLNKGENTDCTITYIDDEPNEKVIPQPAAWDGGGCKYVGAVRWTRFGEIDTFRWNRRDTEDLSEWK